MIQCQTNLYLNSMWNQVLMNASSDVDVDNPAEHVVSALLNKKKMASRVMEGEMDFRRNESGMTSGVFMSEISSQQKRFDSEVRRFYEEFSPPTSDELLLNYTANASKNTSVMTTAEK